MRIGSLPGRQRLPRAQDGGYTAAQQHGPSPRPLCGGQRVPHEVQQESRGVHQRQRDGAEPSDKPSKVVEAGGRGRSTVKNTGGTTVSVINSMAF